MKYSLFFVILLLFFFSCQEPEKRELPKTEQYQNLIGKWEATDSNFLPFDHISYCRALTLGTIFHFDKYGILKVYESSDTKENCNGRQSYWIENEKLGIFEWDMAWNYEILKLTSDSLKIKIDRIPFYLKQELFVGTGNDYNEDPRVKFIRESGIIVTMSKLKNRG